jgi:hypothetical protein
MNLQSSIFAHKNNNPRQEWVRLKGLNISKSTSSVSHNSMIGFSYICNKMCLQTIKPSRFKYVPGIMRNQNHHRICLYVQITKKLITFQRIAKIL